MEASKKIDLFILSKSVLGLMLNYSKQKKLQEAFDIWTADPEKDIYGLGVIGLEEKFQTSTHDTMIYFIISAHLSSFSNDGKEKADELVNQYMNVAINIAIETEKTMFPLIINNWKKNLIEIFGMFIPEQYTEMLSYYEEELDTTVPLGEIDFPKPAKWVIDWKTNERQIKPY